MYTSKKDLAICKMFNINKQDLVNKYMVILDPPYRMRFKKIDDLYIYVSGLTYEEVLYCKDTLEKDAEIIENNIKFSIQSHHLIYSLAYNYELERLNRINRIKKLREFIKEYTPTRRRIIFNRNPKGLI